MNLSDAVTRIADDSNVRSSLTDVKDRLVREINRVCDEIWNGFRWSFRWKNYRIVTDVDVTSGTVTATNGSRTVTGSSTNFTSSHATWHVYFPGDSILNWYKVRAFTSSSQIELDAPYQGTSGSNKAYVLRHLDYVLPTEAWDVASTVVTADNRTIPILDPHSIELSNPASIGNGSLEAVSIYSSDIAPTVYSIGTIAGTLDTNTITGSGTSWLANAYPGDTVTIGNYSYRIRSVDSDTQISLYNAQQITSAAGTTYSLSRQFGRILRILWPSNYSYTVDIRALRLYQPLVNNNDTNELLYRCSNAISLKVSSLELKRQNDKRSQILEGDAEVALQRAKADDDLLTIRGQVAPIYSYRTRR